MSGQRWSSSACSSRSQPLSGRMRGTRTVLECPLARPSIYFSISRLCIRPLLIIECSQSTSECKIWTEGNIRVEADSESEGPRETAFQAHTGSNRQAFHLFARSWVPLSLFHSLHFRIKRSSQSTSHRCQVPTSGRPAPFLGACVASAWA